MGPRNKKEEVTFAEERFRFQVQHLIQSSMNVSGITQAELARRLGKSQANVSQLLSDESNLTVRSVARIFHAMDDRCILESEKVRTARAKAATQLWVYNPAGLERTCARPLPDLSKLALPHAAEWDRPAPDVADEKANSA